MEGVCFLTEGESVADVGAADRWLIDSRQFAERGDVIDAKLGEAALPRLGDEVVDSFDPVNVVVRGVRSPRGKLGLKVALEGLVMLECQRCLQPVSFALASRASFELIDSQKALDVDDQDEWEPVMHSERLDLLPLLEDELLLALPFAPMHDACMPVAPAEAGTRLSPFAALEKLK